MELRRVIDMEKISIALSSRTVDVAEHKNYYELVDRVCFYDAPNANGVRLPYDESALEKAQTLVGMPVYAKYCVTADGEPTFRGHEAYLDEDGEIAFDTEAIGVHMSVDIREDDVEIDGTVKTLPCLFAKQKIWKRDKNVCAAVLRLYDMGKLYNSWEITSTEYSFKDGVKTLDDYVFDGNTYLGFEYASPAYGKSAKVLSLSSLKDSELMIAEALSKDLLGTSSDIETDGKEDKTLSEENKILEPETDLGAEGEEQTAAEEQNQTDAVENVDTSAMTDWDLRIKLSQKASETLGKPAWAAFNFPLDKTVWVEACDRESELDYVHFTYEVSADDEITLSEPQDVKLMVSVAELNSVLSEKNDALVSASAEIDNLNQTIAQLKEIKEKYQTILNEQAESEREAQVKELREYIESSNQFTPEELSEGSEISKMISELKETELKTMVADRVVASLKAKTGKTETAALRKPTVKADIANATEPADKRSAMREFLRR